MRVFCRSFLQTCSSTAIWELTGRFCDSSTVGGFGGELHEASTSSQGIKGVRAHGRSPRLKADWLLAC